MRPVKHGHGPGEGRCSSLDTLQFSQFADSVSTGVGAMDQMQVVDAPLLDRVNAYLKQWRLSPTRFGVMAMGSPSFVFNLRKGATPRPGTAERIEQFIKKGPPAPHRSSRATMNAERYRKTMTENEARDVAARLFRATDEFERAKTFLQQQPRCFIVFKASIARPEVEGYHVNNMILPKEAVIELAIKHGWEG